MAGRPKGEKSFAAMLRIAISEAGKEEGTTRLRDVAEQLVVQAENGNMDAIKEIANRLDGRVPQALVGDGESDPIHVYQQIERVIVSGKADDPDR